MGTDPNILTPEGWHAAMAALEWQVDLGVTEITCEDPIDRYGLPEALKPVAEAKVKVAPVAVVVQPKTDVVAVARTAAAGAFALDALAEALAAFDLCDLKRGAKSTVFADGNPAARVLVLGEAPDRDADIEGRPYGGRAAQLFDRMFAAIGLSRASADPGTSLYITNVMPWRPPQDRDPDAEEIAMMRPFVERHIELANPEFIVLMGNSPCDCLLGKQGILRLRGIWAEVMGRPVLPMISMAYLLRNPAAKREAWADLLTLRARLG